MFYKFPEINISKSEIDVITERFNDDPCALKLKETEIGLDFSIMSEREQMITYIKLLQNRMDYIIEYMISYENFNWIDDYDCDDDKEVVQIAFIMDGDWQYDFKEKLENHWDRPVHEFVSSIKDIDFYSEDELPKMLSDEQYKSMADKICTPDGEDYVHTLEMKDLGFPDYSEFNQAELDIIKKKFNLYMAYLKENDHGPIGYGSDCSEYDWLFYIKEKPKERAYYTDKQIVEYCFILFGDC